MAILEVNLEKPALIEEYQFPSESGGRTATTGTGKTSSGGGKGKFVGLLVVMAGIALAGWKLKNRGKTEQTEFDEFEEEEYERGPEPEIGADEGGSGMRKVAGLLGLVVAVVSLAAAARKRRN